MPVIQLPRGELASKSLTVRLRCGVSLRDLDDIPPVRLMKVVPKYDSGARLPGSPRKGILAFANSHGEDDIIYLVEVFVLAYR